MPLKVFISYNHKDKSVADQLKVAFRNAGHEVVIDSEAMAPGEDIKSFIEKCIRQSDITLSLVSRHSLLSAWVAMESIGTFYTEKNIDKGRFIAAYIDASFFDRAFTDQALDEIDAQIAEIKAIIKTRLDKDRGTADLDNELKRRRDLSYNLDEIVRRLRESLCIDITEGKFQGGVDTILNHFSKIQPASPAAVATTAAPAQQTASQPAAQPANPAATQSTNPPVNFPPKLIIIYDIADDAQSKVLNRHLNILKLTKKIKVYNVHEGLAGSDVMADAERELADADYILPLITDHFVGSEWLGMVWAAAEAKRRKIRFNALSAADRNRRPVSCPFPNRFRRRKSQGCCPTAYW